MKNLIIKTTMVLSIATISLFNANAQSGMNISLKGAPQLTVLMNEDDSDNNSFERKTTLSAAFGLGVSYNFENNLGLGADFVYSLQGQKFKIEGTEFNQKLDYLKIPIYFSISSDPSMPISVSGRVGPMAGILLSAKLQDADGNDLLDDNKDSFESLYLGAMGGVDVNFMLTEKLFATAGAYIDFGFTNTEDEEATGYVADRASSHNLTTGINIGLKYNIGK